MPSALQPSDAPRAVPIHQRLGYRPAAFAALTGLSYVTVWRQIKNRKIDVIDQGGTWTFVFRTQGRDAGQVKVNRSDLSSHDWHFTIPSSASTRLQNEGAPASPCAAASCASHP